MGNLGDEWAEVLLNCPAVNWLDILNVYDNYLSVEMVERLKQMNIQVIADKQKHEFPDDEGDRYCSIAD